METRALPSWRKSSYCESSGCVEIAKTADHVLFRDSKDPLGPVLSFSKASWQDFLADVRSGYFQPQ